MNDEERVYLQDMVTGWRRNTGWEASQLFLRLFTIFNILHVVFDGVWDGDANFKAAFCNSLVASAVLAPFSMIFKTRPMFDE